MRDIQTIFNIVIDEGYYQEYNKYFGVTSPFMCDCIGYAFEGGKITREEGKFTRGCIRLYIFGAFSLESMLLRNNLPSDFNDRKAIYLGWANRPELKDIKIGVK